jgi:hypothetical protein
MQPKISQPEDGKSKIVQIVFEKITSIKTPIQVVSLVLAIVFAITVFQVAPAPNSLALVILLLPFVLLFVVVNKKILETVSAGGNVVLAVIALIT